MTRNVPFSISNIDFLRKGSMVAAAVLAAVLCAFAFLGQPVALAQTTSATLTGTVFDSSGAVVPDATVTLKNEASGDLRSTKSNGEGYFTFASVPPATYTITVEKENFKKWAVKSVVLTSDDKRNITGIKLEPGVAQETVVVEASSIQITPTDSGEKSTLINEHILQNVAIVGQNAAEFVKIMPGMAFTGGVLNQSSYAAQDERTGTGPVGSFSANGTRTAALDITSDGAHIIDPGCNCGQAMNTNADMTAELKVMTSNFGAEEAKGPVVISAIGKSGGQQFHGEAYAYGRSYHLNANDPQNIDAGLLPNGAPVAPKPQAKYFYPGFNIGGPLIIPGTNFNHNRDKLFFFYGMEYYKQDVDNGVYHAVVPTPAMQAGNFAALKSNPPNANGCPYYTFDSSGNPVQHTENCYISDLNGYGVTGLPGGSNFQTTTITNSGAKTFNVTTGALVPGKADPNGQILMTKVYPLPNLDPSVPGANGFNYAHAATRYANMLQERGRVDYNFTQSTKLYVSYNHQHDSAENSLDTLWTGNANSWASPTTPYPTPIVQTSESDVVSANLTKVINPTLTNELIFTYTYLNLPNHFQDRTKIERGALGLNYNMVFNHANPQNLIFPRLTGWGDGISNMLNTGFELNGNVYAKKTLPSVADNLVKVWRTHTTKFGFYWERTWNEQPGNDAVNGEMIFAPWGGGSSGNAYADMLIGQLTQYHEKNFDVTPAFRYITADFYGNDSWKVSRRFTLEYGMRFSHLGPWSDTTGYGFAAWYPALYANGTGASVNVNGQTVQFPGIEWNKANSSTPLSGSGSRLFFYEPRAGFAWDVFGTGRTVLRGGYGMYRFHDEQNVQNGAYGVVRGAFSTPDINGQPFTKLGPSLASFSASGVTALLPNDDNEPRTQSYSFTVAERMPWKSVLEVAYVGSKSDYLSNYNNNFDQINDLGVGGMFNAKVCAPGQNPPWASTGTSQCGWLPNCDPALAAGAKDPGTAGGANSCAGGGWPWTTGYYDQQVAAARPLSYGTLKLIDHKMYSNYNSVQVTWNKQAGHMTFLTNYTFGKALGIRSENGDGSQGADPTNLKSNYGTLPNNRTHIFNLAYVYEFPTMHNGNRFLKGAANGWQISGITQYQTGVDLQAAVAGNGNFNYSGFIPAGTTFMGKTLAVTIQASSENVLGTRDITLMPTLTCDPRQGLKQNQYINGACFSPFATPGVQGNYIFPTLTGPGFFNTDMSLFKNFAFGESRKLQFRFSGYNFLNHPNRTFIAGDPGLNLSFNSSGVLNPKFGYATNTIGHRIIQGMIKFTW